MWKKYRNYDVGIYPEVQRWQNHVLKSVAMLSSVFSDVMVVISTITKIIVVITTQRQTQQAVFAGQTAIKRIPFVTLN